MSVVLLNVEVSAFVADLETARQLARELERRIADLEGQLATARVLRNRRGRPQSSARRLVVHTSAPRVYRVPTHAGNGHAA